MSFKNWLETTNWQQAIEDIQGFDNIRATLHQYGATNQMVPRLLEKILVFDIGNQKYVIDDFEYPKPQEAHEWVSEQSWKGHIENYIEPLDFNAEFWRGIGNFAKLYHGTTEDDWEQIQQSQALKPQDRTRGIANRSMGRAIFTSSDVGTAEYSYDVVLEIDAAKMKADGYMPTVSKESPVEEAELEESLAWAIGLEDYNAEYESGLDPGTVVFYQKIPLKYIERVK